MLIAEMPSDLEYTRDVCFYELPEERAGFPNLRRAKGANISMIHECLKPGPIPKVRRLSPRESDVDIIQTYKYAQRPAARTLGMRCIKTKRGPRCFICPRSQVYEAQNIRMVRIPDKACFGSDTLSPSITCISRPEMVQQDFG